MDADLFRFTTTDLQDLHLAIMTAFEEAAVLAPSLGLDEVRSALRQVGWDDPIADDALQRALASLTGWQLLEVTQDHSARYATPEEFERKNLQWSLTQRGEAAVSGVLRAVDALRHAVGLQAAVLDAIGDDLSDLADLMRQPASPDSNSRIHIALAQVEAHMASLVVSVRQFNGHLQRLLREDGTDDALFADVKRRTVAYLEDYVSGVDRPHRRLVSVVESVESFGLATVFDRALVGANLAPVGGGDPGPAWLAERARHWDALRAWFSPEAAEAPLIDGLLVVARTAIIELLRVLERRWDSRRRSASIASDFRALAGWFADAAGEDEAHLLFQAAFGIWPARHAHIRTPDGELTRPSATWCTTAAAEVAPALRTQGTLAHKGRASRVGDPSLLRAARQRAQAQALADHEDLRSSLTTGGAVRLSSFGKLPSATFVELLSLLATGLEGPLDASGCRRAVSGDGRIEVILRDAGDGRTAVVTTEAGELTGPDLLVTITLSEVDNEEEREELGA